MTQIEKSRSTIKAAVLGRASRVEHCNSAYDDTKTTQKYMLNLWYMSYAIHHYAPRGSPTTNFQLK
jgi:hypothetical protein